MNAVTVHLFTRDRNLRAALQGRFQREPGFNLILTETALESATPGELVLTTTPDCPPDECERLRATGASVVVLAPVPRDADEAAYRAAGADYLPMLLDLEPLLSKLRELEIRHPQTESVVATVTATAAASIV